MKGLIESLQTHIRAIRITDVYRSTKRFDRKLRGPAP
ncbi:hypothetical protein J2R76_003557 [Bradyrhizobium sp. USDA 4532]|nr:hypothetical protein [Bradyrhizobium sp. USDA 4545]MCP1919966.1 hypothetical protein [Bradyrhizobium sp. USDA 4532]